MIFACSILFLTCGFTPKKLIAGWTNHRMFAKRELLAKNCHLQYSTWNYIRGLCVEHVAKTLNHIWWSSLNNRQINRETKSTYIKISQNSSQYKEDRRTMIRICHRHRHRDLLTLRFHGPALHPKSSTWIGCVLFAVPMNSHQS